MIDERRPKESDDSARLGIPEALCNRYFASADPLRQKALGQFMAPPHVADLMASMFRIRSK